MSDDAFRNLFAAADDNRRNRVPSYMDLAGPPRVVMSGALCNTTVSWLFEARSREETTALGKHAVQERIDAAKRICNGNLGRGPCPVRDQCRNWAITQGYVGVFGGVDITQMSLKQMRREKKRGQAA